MSDHQLRLFEPEESEQPEWNPENCSYLANTIVGSMTVEELMQFVYDDIYSIMLEEKDVFLANLDHYGEIEDE